MCIFPYKTNKFLQLWHYALAQNSIVPCLKVGIFFRTGKCQKTNAEKMFQLKFSVTYQHFYEISNFTLQIINFYTNLPTFIGTTYQTFRFTNS